MKLLVIDQDCCGLDFCLRALAYGHEVKLFLAKKKNGEVDLSGNGLVDKVTEYAPWMKWADLVFLTSNTRYIGDLEFYREKYPNKIFGPNKASAALEIDRKLGMDIMEVSGIDIPHYESFDSLKEAERYALKTPGRLVFKLMGDADDKAMSYVANSPADMAQTIREWIKEGKALKGQCMLQEFIPGIEMGVSGWFGPGGWTGHWCENFEHKKFMSGNYGYNTGEMGTVLAYTRKSKLAEEVLEPLTDHLLKIGYVGDVDVNCIIPDGDPALPLELTCRPGWPSHVIQSSLHKGDDIEWRADLLNGDDTLDVDFSIATGVVIAIRKEIDGLPVYGITDENIEHVHPFELMLGRALDMVDEKPVERDMYVSSGDYLCVVTGHGKTVSESAKNAFAVVDEIKVKDMIVRDDIGECLEKQLPELHKQGYATHFKY